MVRFIITWALLTLCGQLAYAGGPLTLPFSDGSTPLWQGWYYNFGANRTHEGIDYGTPCGTSIRAAEDGYAVSWKQPYIPNGGGYSYGEYVLMYHPSIKMYTLYAHLDTWEAFIPRKSDHVYPGYGWAWVKRGTKIGEAGNTGTKVCHLHFELSQYGYATGRVDPYGIYGYSWRYPGCGQPRQGKYYFTKCPPVPPQQSPPGNTCSNPGTWKDLPVAGDFNGDNKFEFTRYYAAVGRWDTALSTGSSFNPLRQADCGHGVGSSWQSVGDVNGDNVDDAFVYFGGATGIGYVAMGKGDGTFLPYQQTNPGPQMRYLNKYFLADVTGDSKDDWVGFHSTGTWWNARSNGSGFSYEIRAVQGHGYGSTDQFLDDVNGDGRADAIVYFSQDGSWYVAYGNPNGSFGPGYTRFAIWHGYGSTSRYMADMNGDGKKDAVAFWNYDANYNGPVVRVWLSDGTGFVPYNNPRTVGQAHNSTLRIFGDATGDGKDDFWFYFPSGGWYVAPSTGGGFMNAKAW